MRQIPMGSCCGIHRNVTIEQPETLREKDKRPPQIAVSYTGMPAPEDSSSPNATEERSYEESNGEIRRVHWVGNLLLRVSSKSRGMRIRRNNLVKIKMPPQTQFSQRPLRGPRIAFSQRGVSESLSPQKRNQMMYEAGSKRLLTQERLRLDGIACRLHEEAVHSSDRLLSKQGAASAAGEADVRHSSPAHVFVPDSDSTCSPPATA